MNKYCNIFILVFSTHFLLSGSVLKRFKRREPLFFGGPGCETIFQCLSATNRIFPFRFNLNPITMVDRLGGVQNLRWLQRIWGPFINYVDKQGEGC